eukprot:Skav210242  [mRNA]  locus=scaffold1929:53601:64160:+ [translate_table: standard]
MSVLPPVSAEEVPWPRAVVLLPFIDEPRLLRILAPLLARLKLHEKALFHAVQLAQAAYEAGHAGLKQSLGCIYLFGFLEGWQGGGANREVASPIEGLPDVEESHCLAIHAISPSVIDLWFSIGSVSSNLVRWAKYLEPIVRPWVLCHIWSASLCLATTEVCATFPETPIGMATWLRSFLVGLMRNSARRAPHSVNGLRMLCDRSVPAALIRKDASYVPEVVKLPPDSVEMRIEWVLPKPGRWFDMPCMPCWGVRSSPHPWGPKMPDKVILYIHGGAYLLCTPASLRGITFSLASALKAPLCVVEYRRPPEHPIPAPMEDILLAYRYLLETLPGVDIILAGDSAGGGIAAAMLCKLRETNLPMPRCCILISPWTDLGMDGLRHATLENEPNDYLPRGVHAPVLFHTVWRPAADAYHEAWSNLVNVHIHVSSCASSRYGLMAYAKSVTRPKYLPKYSSVPQLPGGFLIWGAQLREQRILLRGQGSLSDVLSELSPESRALPSCC